MTTEKRTDQELDALVGALRLRGAPPAAAPPWEPEVVRRRPAGRRTVAWSGGGVWGAAAVAVLTLQPPEVAPVREDGRRGASAPETAEARLWLSVERDGERVRIASGEQVASGERIFFRVGSSAAATLHVWAEGPEGYARVVELSSEGPPQNVPELAYVLAEAGTYTFVASVEGWQQCTPPSCVRFEVVSR